jgi:hypothetical protein
MGRAVVFSEDALQVLERYSWPGNVRELQNVIEQVTWRAGSSVVKLDDLPTDVRSGPAVPGTSTHERRRQIGDDLFDSLVARRYGFWDHVRQVFLDREISKKDLRHSSGVGLPRLTGLPNDGHLFGLRDEEPQTPDELSLPHTTASSTSVTSVLALDLRQPDGSSSVNRTYYKPSWCVARLVSLR